MTYQMVILLCTFLAFILVCLTGKVKIHVAAIAIPVILELTGILTTAQAWAGFANNSVIMMASMFVVGAGLGKTDIVTKLSATIIKPGASDVKIMIGICIPIFLLGCVVNSTATMTIMLPIIAAICAEQNRPVSKFIYPATIFSVMTAGLIPTGGNAGSYLGYNAIIEELGGTGTWGYFTNMISKIPFIVILGVVVIFLGTKMAPDIRVDITAGRSGSEGKGRKKSTLSPAKQKLAVGIFLATVAGIVICALIGKSTWYPSLIGALAMVFSGVLTDREAIQSMGSPIIFIFVGTLPLSTALSVTGADTLIADGFNQIFGNASPWVVMMAMYLMCAILTQFMSNSAVSTAFRVLSALIAVQGGYDARAMMMASSFGSSNCFLLPTAGPVCVMAYEAGGYTMKQYMKQGVLLTILHAVIFAIWIPLMYPLK